ncbi:MAG: FAD:protein FMN transferase [Bacteroidales bacterium]|nr:FAD:protein FMN transferase [Bacteroidales bacterium]
MSGSPSHAFYPDRALFHGVVPHVMGTKLEALLLGAPERESLSLWERWCAEAQRLDAMLDRFDASSEVSRLNAASDSGEILPSRELLAMIRVCEDFRVRTRGLFDITRGTCGEGLQIGAGGSVSLNGGSLDFGGFAKGYFLQECKRMLAEAGIGTAYVDFGGSSILALGHHPFGESWRIRVTHPFSGRVLQDVDLVDQSLSTSGNRPSYRDHIVDPRTGRTVSALRIVTVLTADPLEAEILSTAAMIAEGEELAFLKKNFELSEINRFDV